MSRRGRSLKSSGDACEWVIIVSGRREIHFDDFIARLFFLSMRFQWFGLWKHGSFFLSFFFFLRTDIKKEKKKRSSMSRLFRRKSKGEAAENWSRRCVRVQKEGKPSWTGFTLIFIFRSSDTFRSLSFPPLWLIGSCITSSWQLISSFKHYTTE